MFKEGHPGKAALVVLAALALAFALSRAAWAGAAISDGPQPAAPASPRVIVELETPPLAAAFPRLDGAGRASLHAAAAQTYIAALRAEQAAVMNTVQAALPAARISTFTNELGAAEPHAYQVVFNGMAIHHGMGSQEEALRIIGKLPGVKAVYPDLPYAADLYTSTALINAPAIWNALGGRENGGAGVKVASMDGGVHHRAAMMDGTGYSYPPGYGPAGLGLTSNNNGKIIASRVYFRDWDPPAAGDENPWPGVNGTSHGMHTASTAAGGIVPSALVTGYDVGRISGVAPKAYVMSYRVFYASANGISSFYTAEGIAALEDIVMDGADVVNNSWGGGPGSEGGEFDPLDQALRNAWNAGVFVSMSAGNAGPGSATTDHPSDEYIVVAASTTSGALAAGRVATVGSDAVKDAAFAAATFGAALSPGQVLEYPYLPADVVNPANFEGCQSWPAGAFSGKAALISRGACDFSVKVLNAERAGAQFVVIYNTAAGGDGLITMGPGAVGGQVTIGSLFVGRTTGLGFLAHYGAAADARLQVNMIPFQAGNAADRISNFSSRGPGAGNVLKPDIAAPGVNIVAQGYAEGAVGEARHLGYGQASGTSMAAPHVAGAAALIKQARPAWPNWAIKSALMTTARYMDVYNFDGTPAQPLDMGAGRMDLADALNPGLVLNPPNLSFGVVATGTQTSLVVTAMSVAPAAERYTLGTIWTGAGFMPTQTTTMPGITFEPAVLDLAPGQTKQFTVTFTAANGRGYDHNQGYLTLDGATYDAHMPAWARVTHAAKLADVLIIDNDGSYTNSFYDYAWYYTDTLKNLGLAYHVHEFNPAAGLPSVAQMLAYDAVLWFTGENYFAPLGMTVQQQDRMVEYLNSGGRLLAMGQDLSATIGEASANACAEFLYCYRLGSVFVQDSISGDMAPTGPILAAASAPAALRSLAVDLTAPRRFVRNNARLLGSEEVPPVVSAAGGSFSVNYLADRATLGYRVEITTTTPITVTAAHIHRGAAGVNGPAEWPLTPAGFAPTVVTSASPLVLTGVIQNVTPEQEAALRLEGFYANVHTAAHPAGAVRGQIRLLPYYGQVSYIDELDTRVSTSNPNPPPVGAGDDPGGVPLFAYRGLNVEQRGIVGMARADLPALERPGTTYSGRSIYLAFGLEGVNPPAGLAQGVDAAYVDRGGLVSAMLAWLHAAPGTAAINHTATVTATGLAVFEAAYGGDVQAEQYRWDFGDGSPYSISLSETAGHQYRCDAAGNHHTVRVEITDRLGMVAIGSIQVDASGFCIAEPTRSWPRYLPMIQQGSTAF